MSWRGRADHPAGRRRPRIVQLPGVQDTAKAKDILGRTATLEVRMVDEDGDIDAALRGSVPSGTELLSERGGGHLLVKTGIAHW